MPTYNIQIPPPANWQDFERFCHSVWMDILDDPNIQMNGRLGQEQSGVDIYGYSKNDLFYCIQCKGKNTNYGGKVTEKELTEEIKKAPPTHPAPQSFSANSLAYYPIASSGFVLLLFPESSGKNRPNQYRKLIQTNEQFP